MFINCEIDGEDVECEIRWKEYLECVKKCLEDYTREELIDLIAEEIDCKDIFYDDFCEFFEEKAREQYENSKLLNENPYNQSDFI